MISLENGEMKALWPNDSLSLNFYETFTNSIPKLATFVKQVFDSMISLKSYKMTALWPNEFLTFPFYVIFLIGMPNWTTFVKAIFWHLG